MTAPPRALPRLYALTDLAASGAPSHADLAGCLAAAGVRLIQVREKAMPAGALAEDLAAAVAAARRRGARLVVNDRPDLALLSGADGVHLGQEDLPVEDARRLLGPEALIGVSSHSGEEAVAAAELPADYVAIGPIYESPTKPGHRTGRRPLGPETLEWVRARTDRPLVAIGGVTLERAAELIRAGADSLAVIAGLYGPSGDPAGALEERVAAWIRVLGSA